MHYMKTFLKEFSYEKLGEIRTCQVNHQIMFVGRDVAQALGYKNTRKAIQNHVDDEDREDGVTIRDSIGRYQQAILINESGQYSLILSSNCRRQASTHDSGRYRFVAQNEMGIKKGCT